MFGPWSLRDGFFVRKPCFASVGNRAPVRRLRLVSSVSSKHIETNRTCPVVPEKSPSHVEGLARSNVRVKKKHWLQINFLPSPLECSERHKPMFSGQDPHHLRSHCTLVQAWGACSCLGLHLHFWCRLGAHRRSECGGTLIDDVLPGRVYLHELLLLRLDLREITGISPLRREPNGTGEATDWIL